MKQKLSFVIPCYRSENTVEAVIEEIFAVVGDKAEAEIVAVNDCSPDDVLSVLKRIAAREPRLKVVDLAKNMGKHAALLAGYSQITGDVVFGIDDDGQCPVDKLWELMEPLEHGYDMSLARYPEKKQNALKNFGSKVNAWMTETLLGKPKDLALSNFGATKRFLIDEVLRYKNPYPYLDGVVLRSTSRIANVDMEERERVSGQSGYTFKKSLSLWINGVTAFSVAPLRAATVLGLLTALVGFIFAAITVARKLLYQNIAAGYSSLFAAILFIGGIIMVLLGIIGEYVGRIYISMNNLPQYVIREKINCEKEK